MKLKFLGQKFIGAGIVIKDGPKEIEVEDNKGELLLKSYPRLFEVVPKERGETSSGQKKKGRKEEKEEELGDVEAEGVEDVVHD